MATTVQNIIDAVVRDARQVTPGNTVLIDYVNRISLQMLRHSRWKFLLSDPKQFITEKGRNDYFVGTGTAPAGAAHTKLDLADMRYVKNDSVFDRSNFRALHKTAASPLAPTLAFSDSVSREGRPQVWAQSQNSRNVISLYPAPDNQNGYQPVPVAPLVQDSVAGALAYRQYFVKVVLRDDNSGISAPSATTTQFIPASKVAVVSSPSVIVGPDIMVDGALAAGAIGYSTWDVYIGTAADSLTKQNGAPIAIGTNFTEPGTGLIAGAALPSGTPTITTLGGYVIEFRYYKALAQLTGVADNLQIPDEYKDVVIAGVNALTYVYLKREADAQIWSNVYQSGLRQILQDMRAQEGPEFIYPDGASLNSPYQFDVDSPVR